MNEKNPEKVLGDEVGTHTRLTFFTIGSRSIVGIPTRKSRAFSLAKVALYGVVMA